MIIYKCDACGEQVENEMGHHWTETRYASSSKLKTVHLCGRVECAAWWSRDLEQFVPSEKPQFIPPQ